MGWNWVTPGASDGIWALSGTNAFYNGGNVGIGTGEPFEIAGKCGMDSTAFVRELRAAGLHGVGVVPYQRKEFGGARLNLSADSEANLPALNIHLLSAAQKHSSGSIFARAS